MAGNDPDWAHLFKDRDLRAHILHGNRRAGDRFSGLHFASMGRGPKGRVIARSPRRWKNGVYLVDVFVKGKDGQLHAKAGKTTMFPDEWSKREVFAAGEEALRNSWEHGRIDPRNGEWHGKARGVWNSRVYEYHISGFVSLDHGEIKKVKSFFPVKRPPIESVAKGKRIEGIEL